MSRFLQAIVLVAFCVVAISPASAFELTPIDQIPGFESNHAYAGKLHLVSGEALTSAPEGATVLSGLLSRFPGKPLCAVWYETEDDISKQEWRLVLDTNENGDLTDDLVLKPNPKTSEGEVAIRDFWGRDVPYSILVSNHKRGDKLEAYVFAYPKAVYRGYVDMDGKKRMAVLIDADGNGLTKGSRRCNSMYVDTDGDGKIRASRRPGKMDGYAALPADTVFLMGRVWRCDVDDTKPSAELRPYEGPVGRIAIRAAWKDGPEARPNMVSLSPEDDQRHSDTILFDAFVPAIALPVGVYKLQSAAMELVSPSKKEASAILLLRTRSPRIEVENGKEFALVLDAVPRVEPAVAGSGKGELSIGCSYIGTELVAVDRIIAIGPNAQGSPSGKVRVYRGERPKGEPFFSGSMEYG